jgi:hypothetical protein
MSGASLFESHVEIETGATPVRLAPGLYFGSFWEPLGVAVSFPIGLNNDAPDFAVFVLGVIEFEARGLRPGMLR